MSVKLGTLFSLIVTYLSSDAGEPAPADAVNPCNRQVLENFAFEGYFNNTAPEDLSICGNVPKENNCCNVIDEIKAVKTWTGFSKTKLDNFLATMVSVYKKVLNLHPFVLKMDDRFIKLHYANYTDAVIRKTECFQANSLLSQTELAELVKETTAGEEWFYAYSKKMLAEFINYVSKNSAGLIEPNGDLFQTSVLDTIYASKNLKKLIFNAANNFALDSDSKAMEAEFITVYSNAQPGALGLKGDALTMGIPDFFNKKISLAAKFKEIILANAPKRELKEIHEKTYEIHISNFLKYMTINKNLLFDPPMVRHSDINGLFEEIYNTINKNVDLKILLQYMITPQNIQKPVPPMARDMIKNQLLSAINDNVVKSDKIKKFDRYRLLNYLQIVFTETFDVKKYLATSVYTSVSKYMVLQTLGGMFKNAILTAPDKTDAIIAEFKKLTDSKDVQIDKIVITKPVDSITAADLKPFVVAKAIKLYNQVMTALTLPTDPQVELTDSAYLAANTALDDLLKFNVYVATSSDNTICANVNRYTVVKKLIFNPKKFAHCKKSLDKLLTTDIVDLKNKVEVMTKRIDSLLNIKKSLFCFVCDKTKTKYFNMQANTITYSDQFCFDLLTQFSDVLLWKNKEMVEYFNDLTQYLKCYESTGKQLEFPYKFFGTAQVADMQVLAGCTGISSLQQVEKCKDLCSRFSLGAFSSFFDGDAVFVENMHTYVVKVLRSFGFVMKKKPKVQEQVPSSARLLEETGSSVDLNDIDDFSLPLKQTRMTSGRFDFQRHGRDRMLQANPANPEDDKLNRKKELRKLYFKGRSRQFYFKIIEKIANMKTPFGEPSRPDYKNSNDLTRSRINYSVMEPNLEIQDLKIVFSKEGLNPLETAKSANIDTGLFDKFLEIDNKPQDVLTSNVAHVILSVTQEEIDRFNEDITMLEIDEKMPEKTSIDFVKPEPPASSIKAEHNTTLADNKPINDQPGAAIKPASKLKRKLIAEASHPKYEPGHKQKSGGLISFLGKLLDF